MEHPNWERIAHLRKINRAVYRAIEMLVGKSKEEDATLGLMKSLYAFNPVLARAIHREIIRIDRLIDEASSELACE